MRPLEYLRIFRQRWWVLPITVVLGIAIAFFTEPTATSASLKAQTAAPGLWSASTLVVSTPLGGRTTADVDWDRMALLATNGDVPQAVARELGQGRVRGIAALPPQTKHSPPPPEKFIPRAVELGDSTIKVTPDGATGSLAITATNLSPVSAAIISNAFANQLLIYLAVNGQLQYNAQFSALETQRTDLLNQLNAIYAKQPTETNPFATIELQSERNQLLAQVSALASQQSDLVTAGPEGGGLKILERANPYTASLTTPPTSQSGVLASVSSGPERILVGGLIGLLVGLLGLLLVEVLSARLRDPASVESATRLPVVAEIPEVTLAKSEWFQVLSAEEPTGVIAEAYRSLRTSLLAMWRRHPVNAGYLGADAATNGNGTTTTIPPLRMLLVTSAGPADGKSVSTVNLAAAFAETGSTVIVIDADFRRPLLDRYFARPSSPNLGDLIPYGDDVTPAQLEAVLQETGIDGVRFAASAPPKGQPAPSLAAAKAAAEAAISLADVVILDSPPLMMANDGAELATIADATLLVARSGWTRRSAASRASELLRRLEVTVIGATLVGVSQRGYNGYLGYYGYGYGKQDDGIRGRIMSWRRGRDTQPSPRPDPVDVPAGSSIGGSDPSRGPDTGP